MKAHTSPLLTLGIGLAVGMMIGYCFKDLGASSKRQSRGVVMSADIRELVLPRDTDEGFVQDLSVNGVKITFRDAAYFQRAKEAPVSSPRYLSIPFRERSSLEIDRHLPNRAVTQDLIDMRYTPPEIELPF